MQAYDRVPRDRLWPHLREAVVGPAWIAAAQAIYADMPMMVAGGARIIHTTHHRCQAGLPLSHTLFGLYIDTLETELLAALRSRCWS